MHEVVVDRLFVAEQSSQTLEQIASGDYAAAAALWKSYWSGLGSPPKLYGLSHADKATALWRIGGLTSIWGSALQREGSQEEAKNLLTQALELFREVGAPDLHAQAQVDLGLCYWRLGQVEEARIMLSGAREVLDEGTAGHLRSTCILAMLESQAAHHRAALGLLEGAVTASGKLVESRWNSYVSGSIRNELGLVLRHLGEASQDWSLLDRSLLEFSAASFFFENAGNLRYAAGVEVNLGRALSSWSRYQDAEDHLARARALIMRVNDVRLLAQVDDTRAQVYLLERKFELAERVAASAVRSLRDSEDATLLSETLVTHAISLARLREFERAATTFKRAAEVAENSGNKFNAGNAYLSTFEELQYELAADELGVLFQKAANSLKGIDDFQVQRRVIECGCRLAEFCTQSSDHEHDVHLPLDEMVKQCEARHIRSALTAESGSVTRAARRLNVKHQTLSAMLNSRHGDLADVRSPRRKRRQKSIIKH